METKSQKRLKLLIVIFIIIGFIFIYSLYSSKKQPASSVAVVSGIPIPGPQKTEVTVNTETIQLLSLMKNVNLDVSFFENPVFNSLVDFSVTLPQPQTGRDNPFSPL